MFFFDPLYFVILIPAIALSIWAQVKVKSAFARYSKVAPSSHAAGAEAAEKILRQNGLDDVRVEVGQGTLTDFYDPRKRILRLSPEVYQGRSLAALGVAAHEAGHALQHARGYAPLKLRSGLVPAANFGTRMAFPLIFLGFLFARSGAAISPLLINFGILAFSVAVLFQVVTLPVEFNASRRAMSVLEETGLITAAEREPTRAVLNAAALTYVAAALAAVLQLLYLILRSQRRD
jgi:Zn-dependent membrane protease YugP